MALRSRVDGVVREINSVTNLSRAVRRGTPAEPQLTLQPKTRKGHTFSTLWPFMLKRLGRVDSNHQLPD
jgi:hypothetical protein